MPSFPPFSAVRRGAFGLLELLIIVAILAVVIALAFPVLGRMAKQGQKVKCVSNLRSIGSASMAYAGDHGGVFPNFYYEDEAGATKAPDAVVGQWYWHLAPYLGYDRWPNGGMNLGAAGGSGLAGPVVFHCPAADPKREDIPESLLVYPSLRPVTYAPSNRTRGSFTAAGMKFPTQRVIRGVMPPRLQQIVNPGRKIWLLDSPTPGILNLSDSRWREESGTDAWAYQAFTRHQHGANALFYDGHVESLPIQTFTESGEGSLTERARLYFDPIY